MLTFYEYHLPFSRPFKTAASEFSHRTGVILRYKNQHFDLLSEASPLPGFSAESNQQIKQELLKNRGNLNSFLQSGYSLTDLKIFLDEIPTFPSLQFSVSFLGLAILSKRHRTGIGNLLGLKPSRQLFVNEIISLGNPETILSQIDDAVKCGFSTIKIKAASPPGQLAAVLKKTCEKHNEIQFRLDANQSWPKEKINEYSLQFSGLPIQYIEEPARISSPAELHNLQKKSVLPLALDETIDNPEKLQAFLQTDPELFVLIKPMLFGNFLNLVETISKNRSNHKNVVVTTALESKIGRTMTAVAASLIGDPAAAHGLNTGHFFEQDLFTDFPQVKNGIIRDPMAEFQQCSFQNIEHSLIKQLDHNT